MNLQILDLKPNSSRSFSAAGLTRAAAFYWAMELNSILMGILTKDIGLFYKKLDIKPLQDQV
jgi:hypothetical protein